ncbi:hypothetical protein [Spartinivicinus ruber]|uniref:hypothetical protein n=1 Tax=Spartinivicinus ruber TaxID=2683272 RepID=UPI0013D1B81A|nr:hypothetical protein [Spartinivicinus ruber]
MLKPATKAAAILCILFSSFLFAGDQEQFIDAAYNGDLATVNAMLANINEFYPSASENIS